MPYQRFGIIVLLLLTLVIAINSEAQMKLTVTISNRSDSSIELISVDQAHISSLPTAFSSQLSILPGGSFVLKNHTSKPITAMVVLWTFADADGKTQKHSYTSDGYYIPGDRAVIKPLSVNLVTPSGHVAEERLKALRTAGLLDPIMGSRVDHTRLVNVDISIDSLIFEDGQIWGPDTQKYYLMLLNRRSALESLSAELKEATSRGGDIKAHLEQIRKEPSGRDDRSKFRRDYARFLHDSYTPEALLEKFEAQASLPDFHHDGGNN